MQIQEDDDKDTLSDGGEVIQDEEDDENFQVNMAEVGDQAFITYKRGEYDVVVEKCDFKRSEASGKRMFQLGLQIEGGEYDGKKMPAFLSFSEGALPGTKAALKILNPELAESQWKPQEVADTGLLIGCKARIKVDIQKYKGENRNAIKKWMAPKQTQNEFINA